MDTTAQEGVLETPKDAGPPPQGIFARWRMELDLAEAVEKHWRQDAEEAVKVYRNDGRGLADGWRDRVGRFNILWSNVETLRPAIYSRTPKPVVSRRYKDADPAGRIASKVLERALSFCEDAYDFDNLLIQSTMDMLLPGRAMVWMRYKPTMAEDGSVAYESVESEHVDWRDFRHGPGRIWDEVTWVARRHRLTKDDFQEKFPAFKGEIPLTECPKGLEEKSDEYGVADTFKRAVVWEIWDKAKREVIFIAEGYPEGPIDVVPDPLRLKGFFPCPRPAVPVSTTDSLVPITEYSLYADQARELDRVTGRITRLIEAIKARGIYDTTIVEFSQLMSAEDNDLVPAQNVTQLMERGGLDKAVWMLPVEMYSRVLKELYVQREQIKQVIYEITGLSDIVRGSSVASETATAQRIKDKYGSLRIQSRQSELQRFARDILRMKAEIMAEHFQAQTLQLMTGVEITPEVEQLLRSDVQRQFRIDIETDSTIAFDEQSEKEMITEFLTSFGQVASQIGPAVEGGYLTMPVAKQVIMFVMRRFRAGRDIEEAIEQMPDEQAQPQIPEEIQKQIEQAQQDIQAQQQQLQQAQQQAEQEKQRLQAEQQKLQKQAMDQEMESMRLKYEDQMLKLREQSSEQMMQADAEVIRAKQEVQTVKAITKIETLIERFMAEVEATQQAQKEQQAQTQQTEQVAMTMQAEGERTEAMKGAIMQALQEAVEAITAPKRVIRDQQGRIAAVEPMPKG